MASQRVSNAQMSDEERICQVLSVEVRQTGADPSLFLEALWEAKERKVWEALGVASFAAFVANPFPSGMGADIQNVRHLVQMKHRYEPNDESLRERMGELRTFVDRELRPTLNDEGFNQYSGYYNIIPTPVKQGTSRDYLLARLAREKKDDLLAAVERGELSASRAAIQAGYAKPTLSISREPSKAAATIRRHFTPEQIDELIAALEGEA